MTRSPEHIEHTCLAAATAPTTSTTSFALASACAATVTLVSSRTSSCAAVEETHDGGMGRSTNQCKQLQSLTVKAACKPCAHRHPWSTATLPTPYMPISATHLCQLHHLRLLLNGQHDGVGAQHARHAAKQQQRARHAAALPPCRRACGAVAEMGKGMHSHRTWVKLKVQPPHSTHRSACRPRRRQSHAGQTRRAGRWRPGG